MKRIDFTPQWYRLQLQVKEVRRRRISYVAAMAILMCAWLLINHGRVRMAQAALGNTQQLHTQAVARNQQLQTLKEQQAATQRQLDKFDDIASSFPKRLVFTEISHCIPERVWLIDFKLQRLEDIKPPDKDKKRRRGRSVNTRVPDDVQYSDLVVTFRAQAEETGLLRDFFENLQASELFERVTHKATVPVVGSRLKEKQISLFVIGTEHIGS